jgi:hypothetical protein
MRLSWRAWSSAVLLLAVACGEGDRIRPGQIKDLTFFTDPKAIAFNGNFSLGPERPIAKTMAFAWTATGENEDKGIAALYDMRYITETEIAAYNLNENALCDINNLYMHKVIGESFPQSPGSPEAMNLIPLGLERGRTYHFCLWAVDEIGQYGNPASAVFQIPFLGIALRSVNDSVAGLGQVVSNINDFNGDGIIDVSVASPSASSALVWFGRTDNMIFYNKFFYNTQITLVGRLNPDLVFTGDAGAGFGNAVSGVGDIDKDGIAELLVSAPTSVSGSAYIFKYSQTSPVSTSQAMATMTGENPGDLLGASAAQCGDLNNDTFPDFVVSAPAAGKVYVVLGGNTSTPLGPLPAAGSIANAASAVILSNPGSGFGSSLDCGTDLNADGIADLLIGAPRAQNNSGQNTGAAYVFLAGANHVINFNAINSRNLPVRVDLTQGGKADLAVFGNSAGQNFGQSVAQLGDVVGRSLADASRDFAVSAPGAGTGNIYLFYGGVSGALRLDQLTAPAIAAASQADASITGNAGELIGGKISGRADLNKDGHFDLLTSNGIGAARVYYLVPGIAPSLWNSRVFQSQSAATDFALLPDFDSDGMADILLGATGETRGYLLK